MKLVSIIKIKRKNYIERLTDLSNGFLIVLAGFSDNILRSKNVIERCVLRDPEQLQRALHRHLERRWRWVVGPRSARRRTQARPARPSQGQRGRSGAPGSPPSRRRREAVHVAASDWCGGAGGILVEDAAVEWQSRHLSLLCLFRESKLEVIVIEGSKIKDIVGPTSQ